MKTILTTLILAIMLSASALALCADNDAGALSYEGSYATDEDGHYIDFCLENGNVMEYTCVEGQVQSEEMPCLLGCHTTWDGYGKCVPTAGGSTSSMPEESGSASFMVSSEGEQPLEVPEFDFLAAGIALVGATGGYLLLRSRK